MHDLLLRLSSTALRRLDLPVLVSRGSKEGLVYSAYAASERQASYRARILVFAARKQLLLAITRTLIAIDVCFRSHSGKLILLRYHCLFVC